MSDKAKAFLEQVKAVMQQANHDLGEFDYEDFLEEVEEETASWLEALDVDDVEDK